MNEVMLNKYEGSSTKINFHGIPYISFPALERLFWIRHGFSTRLGGVSSKHLASLNLAFHRGDLEQNVHQNFERIADAIGFEVKNLVLSHQTHTTNIRQVTKEDCGKGIFKERDFENIDGLITNEKMSCWQPRMPTAFRFIWRTGKIMQSDCRTPAGEAR